MTPHILTIIPLSKSLPKDHLTYFSTKDVSLGDIVEIPIQKRSYKGLVIKIEDAQKNKANLKDSSFQLKAISKVLGPSPFSEPFFKIVKELRRYHIGTNTQILNSLLPAPLVHNIDTLTTKEKDTPTEKTSMRAEKLVFQSPWNDRVAYYKTHIRESFARGESVRICVPTIALAQKLEQELQRGIKEYCVVFHSKKTQKKIVELFNFCQTTHHPLCIIHTSGFLCVPRTDARTLIVEHESSASYRSQKKPFIDFRLACELYAKETKQKLILADTLLRTETLVRHSQGECVAIGNLHFRIDSPAKHIVVDMRKSEASERIISRSVLQKIVEYYKQGKKIILFALRSSLATTVVCNNCGTTLTYKGFPVSLHEQPENGERFLYSKKYKHTLSADTNCSQCGGWDLIPLGIGTERIESIVKELGSQVHIRRIDQNNNTKTGEIDQALEEFYSHKGGSILITSLSGIPHIHTSVSLCCVISFDTLLNIPQYNMYEQIMHIIMDLSNITEDTLYIQTRHADQKIVSILQNKKLSDFFEYDFTERKHWNYPPFSTIIKMSYEGPRNESSAVEQYILKTFQEYEVFSYHTKSLTESKRITHALLKIPNAQWPLPGQIPGDIEGMQKLYTKLAFLPPNWTIVVNPHTLV